MSRSLWDVARVVPRRCKPCGALIGVGEQFRRSSTGDYPICVGCADRNLGELPPADMPVLPLVPALKAPAAFVESDEPLLASTSQRRRLAAARRRQGGSQW